MYKGGKLGAEIAGTAGAGGVVAKGAMAVPMLAKYADSLSLMRLALLQWHKVWRVGWR